MKPAPSHGTHLPPRGFTLAETLFAMAIIAFVLLSIIGLMPSALAQLNDAERRSAEARILQSLAAEYELKSWTEVKNLADRKVYYFDIRGVRLRSLNDDTQYAAQVDIMQPTTGSQEAPGEITLPGEGSAGDYLRRLRVSISDRPRDPLALTGDNSAQRRRDYPLILVNREPDLPQP